MTPREWRSQMAELMRRLSYYLFQDVTYSTTNKGKVFVHLLDQTNSRMDLGPLDPDDLLADNDIDVTAHGVLMLIAENKYLASKGNT